MNTWLVVIWVVAAMLVQGGVGVCVFCAIGRYALRKRRSKRARRAINIAAEHGLDSEVAQDIDLYGDDPAESLIEWDLDWRSLDRDDEEKR